jgi:3-hydroxymyristoyl/3-hydroxydecanoyl-(acyl carrier protein) dehydratase
MTPGTAAFGPQAARPLLSPRDLAAPLAWRGGQPVSAGEFLAQAEALAERLPAGRPINLCQDRLHFAIGLAAALLRGQTSLMPPNALPETLRQVPSDGGEPYLLVDETPPATGGLRLVPVALAEGLVPARAVPLIPGELPAVCLLTSGSTGAPQPHLKCWGPLVLNIEAEAARLAEMLGQPSLEGLTLLGTVPPQHSYGLESTVLLALLGGAGFAAGRPFYPADIADALAALPAPRALVTTPFHLKTLLLAGLPLPPVALTLSATAPLSPQLAAQAEARLQGPLIEIYGCTEAGQVASRRTTAGQTWHTLGALRLAPAAARPGEVDDGRCVVSGGHVPEPTVLADVLQLHDERHFELLGRANDLIHVAGKRSSLAHLNFHLNRIEGVEDGAFWMPDEVAEGVVRPIAFVVAPTLGAKAVIAALRRELEPIFVPRTVVHVERLPREATGKLTVATLRRFAAEQLGAAAAGAAATAASADEPADKAVHEPADKAVHEAGLEAELIVPEDHPAFAGHFPGHPVLPGAVLLSLVMQALAERPLLAARVGGTPRLDNAKFLQPVGPGARLRLQLGTPGAGVSFELLHQGRCVARGQFAAADTAATSPTHAAGGR